MEQQFEKKWYLIHTYSGYEKKVKTDLEKRVQSLGLEDRVFRILVPEEEVLEEKRGKKVLVSRKLLPSYVMVEMRSVKEFVERGLNYRVDSEAWYIIRNTNGVTGFVGVGSDPIPISDEEVDRIMKQISKKNLYESTFEIGENVIIKKGAFSDAQAKVVYLDKESNKVKVEITTLGRIVTVDLTTDMIEKENSGR